MSLRIFTIIQLIISSTLLMISHNALANSFESLLMPGPVIEAHKKFEQDCNQCHDTSDNDNQGHLCVQCHDHENILDDLSKKTGFHGRLSRSEQNNCKHCHTEHEGRNADVILLSASTFNHGRTDFKLEGEHTRTSCDSCHEKNEKHSEAPSDCYSCHKDSDVHKGEQGKECDSCHSTDNWKKTEFDHGDTDFPLEGSHEKLSCSSCHIDQKYDDTPKTCFGCHQINDVHKTGYGEKCESCHESSEWNKAHFDHRKETDFPLHGKHKEISCNSCHTSGNLEKEVPEKCVGCHKNDDSHKGRYGKKCADCHSSSSWQKQRFNHDKKTDFPLIGKHKKVTCSQCHKGDLYIDEVTSECVDCHKNDDVHKGEQGKKCHSCHNEEGWHRNLSFDHDLARFPLIGMHAVTQCEECHLSTDHRSTESGCNSCHADDDVHESRLGTDCETCHNPNAWEIWIFDHDKSTDFKLEGAHKEAGCYDCHRTKSNDKLEASKDCISCHRTDDIHNRQFGRHCNDCHSTENFKDIEIR